MSLCPANSFPLSVVAVCSNVSLLKKNDTNAAAVRKHNASDGCFHTPEPQLSNFRTAIHPAYPSIFIIDDDNRAAATDFHTANHSIIRSPNLPATPQRHTIPPHSSHNLSPIPHRQNQPPFHHDEIKTQKNKTPSFFSRSSIFSQTVIKQYLAKSSNTRNISMRQLPADNPQATRPKGLKSVNFKPH